MLIVSPDLLTGAPSGVRNGVGSESQDSLMKAARAGMANLREKGESSECVPLSGVKNGRNL